MDNDSQIPIIQNVVHKKSVSMMMCNYKVIVKIQKSNSMRTTNTMMIWIDWKKKIQNLLLNLPVGSYINHEDSWGGGRLAKWPFYYISLISFRPRREERGQKCPKIWPRGLWMTPEKTNWHGGLLPHNTEGGGISP